MDAGKARDFAFTVNQLAQSIHARVDHTSKHMHQGVAVMDETILAFRDGYDEAHRDLGHVTGQPISFNVLAAHRSFEAAMKRLHGLREDVLRAGVDASGI